MPKIRIFKTNVETFARKYPGTYSLPPREMRASLKVGDSVKIILDNGEDDPERLWVLIKRVTRGARGPLYRGVIDSYPMMKGVAAGSVVQFGPQHVAHIDDIDP